MKRILIPFLFICGCGYSEDQFADDFLASNCDLFTRCEAEILQSFIDMGLDEATAQTTVDGMIDPICNPPEVEDTGTTEEPTCTFNADNAQACIDELDALVCADWIAGMYAYPEVCSKTCE